MKLPKRDKRDSLQDSIRLISQKSIAIFSGLNKIVDIYYTIPFLFLISWLYPMYLSIKPMLVLFLIIFLITSIVLGSKKITYILKFIMLVIAFDLLTFTSMLRVIGNHRLLYFDFVGHFTLFIIIYVTIILYVHKFINERGLLRFLYSPTYYNVILPLYHRHFSRKLIISSFLFLMFFVIYSYFWFFGSVFFWTIFKTDMIDEHFLAGSFSTHPAVLLSAILILIAILKISWWDLPNIKKQLDRIRIRIYFPTTKPKEFSLTEFLGNVFISNYELVEYLPQMELNYEKNNSSKKKTMKVKKFYKFVIGIFSYLLGIFFNIKETENEELQDEVYYYALFFFAFFEFAKLPVLHDELINIIEKLMREDENKGRKTKREEIENKVESYLRSISIENLSWYGGFVSTNKEIVYDRPNIPHLVLEFLV